MSWKLCGPGWGAVALVLLVARPGFGQTKADDPQVDAAGAPAPLPAFLPAAPPYAPAAPVAGALNIVGSATMSELAHLWARDFQRIHPDAKIQIDCRGSEHAVPGLAKETPTIALMSRAPTADDLKAVEAATGAAPAPIVVGAVAMAIVVHPDNPLESITWAQLRRALAGADGADGAVSWEDLGAEGAWAKEPVVLHGLDADSGTRRFVMGWALREGDRERSAAVHATHTAVFGAVAADKNALGYATRPADARGVKTLALREDNESFPIPPTDDAVLQGRYPLVRNLYLLAGKADEQATADLKTEFVRFVLSRSGQSDVVKEGFLPLSRPALNEQFDKLGWNNEK